MAISKIQIGKQGITDNFIKTLEDHFKKVKNVKVSVLKSAGHDRNKMKEMSEELLKRLGNNFTAKVIGFTISLKKWRRQVR
jgi:RNA-binding protein YhbY